MKKTGESGQAVTEYVLLLTILMGTLLFFVHTLSGKFYQMSANFGGKVEKQARTGAAPASLWKK